MPPPTQPTLGVLQLANTPTVLPGSTGDPAAYDAPVRFLQVPGAWPRVVLGDDAHTISDAYVESAKQLEREGVAAITSNCGFTARFQPAVAASVSVPVALSSLLLVPFVARFLPPGHKVGVVTYDSTRLREAHCRGAGWSLDDAPVVVAGIDGSESWHELGKDETHPILADVERDVTAAALDMLEAHPDIATLVFECAAFTCVTAAVRRATGLPVADFITLANFLIASVTAAPALGRAAAE